MDETPVWFDMAGNFTINTKGDKIVHIRKTVVLTCTAGKLVFFSNLLILPKNL